MDTSAGPSDNSYKENELCKYTVVWAVIKTYLQIIAFWSRFGDSCWGKLWCDSIMGDVEMVQYGLDNSVWDTSPQNTMPIVLLFNHKKVCYLTSSIYCIVNSLSYCVVQFHREVNQKGLQRNTFKCNSRQEVCASNNLHSGLGLSFRYSIKTSS